MQRSDKQQPPFETVLRRGLERHRSPGGADCPDDAALAAYCERSLSASERAHCEEHFSQCARCQGVLAATARAQAAAAAATPHTTWRRWQPYAALAAGVAGISIAVGLMVTGRRHGGPGYLATNNEASAPAQIAGQAPSTVKVPGPQIALNEPAPRANPAADAPSYRPYQEDQPEAAAPKVPGAPMAKYQRGIAESKPGSAEAEPESARGQTEFQPARKAEQGILPPRLALRAPSMMIEGAPAEAPPPPPMAMNERGFAGSAAPGAPSGPPASQAATAEPVPLGAGMMSPLGGISGRPTAPLVSIRTADNVERWRLAVGGEIQHLGADGRWYRQYRAANRTLNTGDAASPQVCWVVGTDGTVLRTTDGEHWQNLDSPTSENLVAISASNASSALVTAADGRHFATDDGGRTWRPM
ncbi:MAG: hypothetical protein ACLQU2_16265 [Candidatus Binataceae bacterium]